jgi:hypothetical protein
MSTYNNHVIQSKLDALVNFKKGEHYLTTDLQLSNRSIGGWLYRRLISCCCGSVSLNKTEVGDQIINFFKTSRFNIERLDNKSLQKLRNNIIELNCSFGEGTLSEPATTIQNIFDARLIKTGSEEENRVQNAWNEMRDDFITKKFNLFQQKLNSFCKKEDTFACFILFQNLKRLLDSDQGKKILAEMELKTLKDLKELMKKIDREHKISIILPSIISQRIDEEGSSSAKFSESNSSSDETKQVTDPSYSTATIESETTFLKASDWVQWSKKYDSLRNEDLLQLVLSKLEEMLEKNTGRGNRKAIAQSFLVFYNNEKILEKMDMQTQNKFNKEFENILKIYGVKFPKEGHEISFL